MRTNLSTLLALSACAVLTASCARTLPPFEDAAPPQRTMPATAAEACAVYVLTGTPTIALLEEAYIERGKLLAACDRKRQLAVDVHAGEHADEAAWLKRKAERRRPPWKVW